jgi:LmbE family N-acetylglucosaminyl deacetylase
VNHPYNSFINDFVRLLDEARTMTLGDLPNAPAPRVQDNAPRALVFAPHPDDESINGGLPLRLRRELRYRVSVVAVTQGSRVDHQTARLGEMKDACRFLGFELIPTQQNGLAGINMRTRSGNPEAWADAVAIIAEIISYHRPTVLFVPHDDDFNTTHNGTHHLVLDALKTLGPKFKCYVIETEFWRAMAKPNLMVESSPEDVSDLVAATSFHKSQVERNPYHLHLPSWMSDNVRRGSELVGGQGTAAPAFHFATLYRIQEWADGGLKTCLNDGVLKSAASDLATLFN